METFGNSAKDPPKEAKEQGGDIELETLSQGRRSLGQPIVYTPSEKVCLELHAEQKPAFSTQVSSVNMLDEQVIPLLRYLDGKMEK
ncbi:hypothetical protein AXG93_509s1000 [Marchantia polymorpha subsp. ruderalis]|uniref:Uncharacterized protein n=1 Tax=Marchantia polymorpha subsp. ruderalis TaxID=1480154 RepID=A0A176W942_MARPO|nr:hypothetical protein AXG93_509s1000 [Marchantia polymorpha subsp. ruderalis]